MVLGHVERAEILLYNIIRNQSIHSMCRLPAALISSYALQVAESREDRQIRTCLIWEARLDIKS